MLKKVRAAALIPETQATQMEEQHIIYKLLPVLELGTDWLGFIQSRVVFSFPAHSQ